MLKSILTCAILFAAVLATACNRDASAVDEAKNGSSSGPKAAESVTEKVGDNIYANQQFGLTVSAPEGWFVANAEITQNAMDAGVDIMAAEQDARTKAMMGAALKRTRNLFTFTEHPPGAPVDSSASIMAIAENVAFMPGIKNGQDYFFHTKKLFEQINAPVEIVGGYTARKIGGQMFDRMDLKMTIMGQSIQQRMYAARHGEWIVGIVSAYQTDQQLAELDKILDSIKLDW
jgi:hypothetical protein